MCKNQGFDKFRHPVAKRGHTEVGIEEQDFDRLKSKKMLIVMFICKKQSFSNSAA